MSAIIFPDAPNAMALFTQVQGGSFNTGILDTLAGGLGKLGSILSGLESLAQLPDATSVVTDAIGAVTDFGTCLCDATEHAAQQFRDLPANLHLMTVSKDIREATGGLSSAAAGYCSDINDFFSSIMGGLDSILDAILGIGGLLDDLMQAVSGGLAALGRIIGRVISGFTDAIAAITAMIDRELATLAAALKDLLDFSFMNSFLSLFGHPCVKTVMGVVGTAGLLGSLGS
jgi:hypothetical protein